MRTGVRENSERTERETYSSVDTLTFATHREREGGGGVAAPAVADDDGDDDDGGDEDEEDDGHIEYELQMWKLEKRNKNNLTARMC